MSAARGFCGAVIARFCLILKLCRRHDHGRFGEQSVFARNGIGAVGGDHQGHDGFVNRGGVAHPQCGALEGMRGAADAGVAVAQLGADAQRLGLVVA